MPADPQHQTTQTAGYACRPEVRALARMHYDRERLAGDWDDCERAVLDGLHPARARILDRLLTEHLRKAERDIADVRAVMEGFECRTDGKPDDSQRYKREHRVRFWQAGVRVD